MHAIVFSLFQIYKVVYTKFVQKPKLVPQRLYTRNGWIVVSATPKRQN